MYSPFHTTKAPTPLSSKFYLIGVDGGIVRQRISDIITLDVIENEWEMGMKILIKSQMGTGKTYWAQNTLYEYCKKNNYKCLFFSNRNLLRRQNEKSLIGKEDVFETVNYQNVSEKIYGGIDLSEIYNGYDVVLLDEIQFFLSDSSFNRKTDLLLKSLKYKYPDKLIVLMSATPEMLFEYKRKYDKVYDFPDDYSYIEKLSFYRGKEAVINILKYLPVGEKAIYFANSAEEAYNIMMLFKERASFICSPQKELYGNFCDLETLNQIAENDKFECDILCTTKILDTGVNIKDPLVKTVIMDGTDPTNIIQSIGRRRIENDGEKISIYMKNVHGGDMFHVIKRCREQLWWVEELKRLGKEEFQMKYKKERFPDIIDNDASVNVAVYHYYNYIKNFYENYLKKSDINFRKHFRKYFQIPETKEELFAEYELQKPDLVKIVEENKGIKFFEEDQSKISEKFFSAVLSSNISNKKCVGINAIKKILKYSELPYTMESKRETGGKRRFDTYWVFVDKKEGEADEKNRE
jgi:hypothetical protein